MATSHKTRAFLYEGSLSLLTKRVDLNDTVEPLMQKVDGSGGKERKVATALKIHILFYTRKGLLPESH